MRANHANRVIKARFVKDVVITNDGGKTADNTNAEGAHWSQIWHTCCHGHQAA